MKTQFVAWAVLGVLLTSVTPALADTSQTTLPGPGVAYLVAMGVAAVIGLASRRK